MLPTTSYTPVIRTDFSDQQAWEGARAAILAPGDDGDVFAAQVEFVDDPAFADSAPEQILALVTDDFADRHPCLFIVDKTTVSSADWPVLVIDLCEEKGRMFRSVADQLFSIESNLSVSNMGFSEFAEAADDYGIFRGFGGPSRSVLKAQLPPFMLNPSRHTTAGNEGNDQTALAAVAGPGSPGRPDTRAPAPIPLRGIVHLQDLGDVGLIHGSFAGTRGQSRRLEGFLLRIDPPVPGLAMQYMAHLQDIGDTQWVDEGQFVGTRGQSRRLEGFAIRLVGPAASRYSVLYMAHLRDTGDTWFFRDSQFCGTRGQSRRLEGMLVSVTPR